MAAFFGGIVIYISRFLPIWGVPILHGVLAALLLLCIFLAARALRTLPPAVAPTTVDNVEARALEWLHNLHFTVKNDPIAATYFRFFIVTDGGIKMYLGRPKDHQSGYLLLMSEMKANPEEVKIIESLSDEEKLKALLELKLEFSRARIGYSSLDVVKGFLITRLIPISNSLSEDTLINAIWEIEAVINSAMVLNNMASQKHRLNNAERLLAN